MLQSFVKKLVVQRSNMVETSGVTNYPSDIIYHHAKLGLHNICYISLMDSNHLKLPQVEKQPPNLLIIYNNIRFHRAALVNEIH